MKKIPNAVPCGTKYQGKKYSKFTVLVSQSGVDRELWQADQTVVVIADSPEAAIEWVRDNEKLPVPDYPAEWTTYGPRGGRCHRYSGWFTTIGKALWDTRKVEQLPLL